MSRPFESDAPFLRSLAPMGEVEIVVWLRRAATALENLPVQGGAHALRLQGASRAVHLALVELEPFS